MAATTPPVVDEAPAACCATQFHEGAGHDRDCEWWRLQEPRNPQRGRGVR